MLKLWEVPLNQSCQVVEQCRLMLSAEELERAQRFVHADLQEEYTVAHAALRQVLCQFYGGAPSDLEIFRAEYGKPYCNGSVQFNLSHCRGAAVIAVTDDGDVGVDIELMSRKIDLMELAERYYTPNEVIWIQRQGDLAQRRRAFFRLWTIKEAALKFTGEGLRRGIDSIEISHVGQNSWQVTDLIPDSLSFKPFGRVRVNSYDRGCERAEQLVSLVCSNQKDAVEWLSWAMK